MNNMLPSVPGNSIQQYLSYIHSIPVLSVLEETALLEQMATGCKDATRKIILHHLRFVAYIAHKYRSTIVPIEDLIQEGNIGLLNAVNGFNLAISKGIRFASYAVYHIKSAVLHYARRNFKIIDIVKTNVQRKLYNNKSMFKSEFLDNSELMHIASTLNVSIEDVIDMHARLSLQCQTVMIGEDGVYDILPIEDDRYSPHLLIEQLRNEGTQDEKLSVALAKLSNRDQQILRHRYLSDEKLTLVELGKLLNMSYERVRQIEQKLIQQLRNELNGD